jgi:hypothetical protein
LWPYSRILFDGVLAGALAAWAAAWAMTGATRGSRMFFVMAGAALGAAVATRTSCAVLVPAFLWYAGSRGSGDRPVSTRGRAAILCLIAGMLPFAAWQLYYNALRTGSPLVPAVALPQFAGNNGFAATWIGAAGLLASPGKAIWLYAPTVVLALIGFRRFWRKHADGARLVLLAAAPFVLLHASVRNWSGDWGWGPRYLVTILPLVFLAVPFALERAGRVRRRVAIGLIVAGLAAQLPALIVNWEYRYLYVAQQTGRTPDAWSIERSQLADAIAASIRNVRRTAGEAVPIERVDGAHPVNVHASNHVNVWWLTAHHAGVPLTVCVSAALALSIGGALLLWPFVRDAASVFAGRLD